MSCYPVGMYMLQMTLITRSEFCKACLQRLSLRIKISSCFHYNPSFLTCNAMCIVIGIRHVSSLNGV